MQTEIEYQIRSSARARHIRITIYPGGRVVVTKPLRVSVASAEEFIRSKSAWIAKKINFQKNRKSIPLAPAMSRSDALAFVKSRIELYNQHYRFNYGRVSIKDHKSLWGSCSVRKNLNFNHRITQLPLNQADYIIVHELCHLKEMNHSENFWALVRQTVPDYRAIRKELKNYSFY
ncbi:MAG: YgjP-like metallopeptidase domain-containing protein [Candidatus Doudnabacteria bacterium]